ncbi:MAG: tandem-95 repeat protein [Chloroflexi bacterium]|nr:tandem-95 repeat protein [Chloroflexota bacterium]
MLAIFPLIVLQQVLAASQIENNNGLTVDEGQSGVITANELSVTDTDGIYTVFTYTVLTAPVNGDLRNGSTPLTVTDIFTQGLIDAGLLNYLHDGSETISDSFDFNVTNGVSTFVTSTFQITITPVNDAPTGMNDLALVNEADTVTQVNIPLTDTVLANDTDPDSAVLTASIVTNPAQASNFVLNDDGTFSYTHNGSETTSDYFTYMVCDTELSPLCDSNPVTVTISITPVNDAPTAVADTAVVDEGGTVTQVNSPLTNSVLDNDNDVDSAPITATVTISPTSYSNFVFFPDGTFSYTHNGDEPTADDSFTYEVCDDEPLCASATVTITINAINDAPVANDDTGFVSEGESVIITPDVTDEENDTLSVTQIITSPSHASSLTINPNNTITYQHDGDLPGSTPHNDFFVYEICEVATPNNCDTARIDITITPVNDPPLAVADTFTVAEGATLNDTVNPTPGPCTGNSNDCDEEDDPFVVITTTVSPSAYAASFNLQDDGSFTYVHDGSETTSDTFTYRVCKEANSPIQDCSQTDVTINITSVNDAPTPGNDFMTVPRSTTSTTLNGGVTSLLANDSDPENDALTVTTTPVSGPAHGSLTLNADGTFSYTHDDSGNDPDSFTYEVCDDGSPQECNTAVVSITIGPRPTTTIFLPVILNNFPTDEPNNNACDAFPIGLNSNYIFLSNDQEDWYSFTLSSAKTVNIILENDTSQNGVATQLLVYQGSCTGIQQIGQDGTTNQNKSVQLTNLAAGTYFVRVFSSPITNTGYTLKVNTQ